MNEPMMKCGHTANSYKIVKGDKKIPGCVICNCFEVADSKPNLEGRKARCPYCNRETMSDWSLPFFQYKESEEYDEYYDGCFGWD